MAFREGPFENLKVPLAWTAAVAVVVAGAAAAVLLLGDKRETLRSEGYGGARATFDKAAAPANGILAAPVRWVGQGSDWLGDYFNAVEENRRLKVRLRELEAVRDNAIALKNVNARYEALLNLRTQPAIDMATARAVSESRGPFANSRLIDAGSDDRIKIGNPVINEHGLVGRVVGVSRRASRVLLLTDVASRTPVLIDRTDARAIMVGDGGANPRLDFVRGHGAVKEGDRILTSGDGGMIPRGLPVGVAAKAIDGSWRVKLLSDRGGIDFVRILLFQDFSQLLRPDELNAPPLAALNTAPPPTVELANRIEAMHPARTFGEPTAAARPAPAAAAPAQAAPAQKGPVQVAPPQKAPPQAAPVQKAPVQKTPAQKAPVQPAPAQKAPAQKAPAAPPADPTGATRP